MWCSHSELRKFFKRLFSKTRVSSRVVIYKLRYWGSVDRMQKICSRGIDLTCTVVLCVRQCIIISRNNIVYKKKNKENFSG